VSLEKDKKHPEVVQPKEEKLVPFIKSHTGWWCKVEQPNFSVQDWKSEVRMHPEGTQNYREADIPKQRRVDVVRKGQNGLEQQRVVTNSTISKEENILKQKGDRQQDQERAKK